VWSYLVVVLPPTLELVTHVDERKEYLDVQALIPQPTAFAFATRAADLFGSGSSSSLD
jgi:hypothetical protein